MQPVYATVEQVSASPEMMHSAYAKDLIITKLAASTRSIEDFLHRRFYPERRTILVDWPNHSFSPSWEIDLGINEMISVSQVLSNGTDITSDVILRRADDIDEPPYDLLQVDLSSNAAFSAGTTWQQAITITGLFSGDKDTSTALAGSVLSGGINASVTTIVLNPSSGYYTPGIGSLLLIGTERMLVANRNMASSGQIISADVAALQSTTIVPSGGAATFAIGEVILIDGERMLINDIAGTNLIVTRAWDGTTLAAHTNGATIYGLRQFIVQRGALGSTAASHSDAASVYTHEYPPTVNELCVAETLVSLQRQIGAYGGGAPDSNAGRSMSEIKELRERVWAALARKGRLGAV
jgi:hypothetical protein